MYINLRSMSICMTPSKSLEEDFSLRVASRLQVTKFRDFPNFS